MQLSSGIRELSLFHIDEKAKMAKEISSKNWSLHICDDGDPRERSAET